jgi:hypothetical protein
MERETKLIISSGDYRRLLETGDMTGCGEQLNVYLHDPARILEAHGYFRVRFESEKEPVATLKLPVGWKGEMREMVEVERPLSVLGPDLFPRPRRWVPVDPNLPGVFREHFRKLGITRLRRLGWMRNRRCVVHLGPSATVEVDRTRLPDGTVHFEVEIEDPSAEHHGALVERVTALAPSARATRVGKFTRFMVAAGILDPPERP